MPTDEATFDTSAVNAGMDALLAAGAPAVLVEVRDGNEVWRSAVGVTTVTGAEKPDPLAGIRVASVTKSMLGTLLMQLVADGEVDLDEPIATYLPELRLGREVLVDESGTPELEPSPTPTGPSWTAPASTLPPQHVPPGAEVGADVAFDAAQQPILNPAQSVTPRMLAQHTAGLPDYIGTFPLGNFGDLSATLEQRYDLPGLIRRVGGLPWSGQPGAGFAYSNTNYLVLSLLIERVTGRSIDEALRERVFEAGNLGATSLPVTPDLPPGSAHGHFTQDGVYVDVSRQSGTLWSGAGGVVSTTGDVNSFYRALLQGTYLAPADLALMLSLNGSGYGIGVQGHVDPCGPGAPVLVGGPSASATATATAGAGAGVGASVGATVGAGAGAPDGVPAPSAGAASPVAAGVASPTAAGVASPTAEPLPVQIGKPGMTYGHMGSGLGYRILSFSSPDGLRQVTVAWTASPLDYATDPRLEPAWRVVDAALLATCSE